MQTELEVLPRSLRMQNISTFGLNFKHRSFAAHRQHFDDNDNDNEVDDVCVMHIMGL